MLANVMRMVSPRYKSTQKDSRKEARKEDGAVDLISCDAYGPVSDRLTAMLISKTLSKVSQCIPAIMVQVRQRRMQGWCFIQ